MEVIRQVLKSEMKHKEKVASITERIISDQGLIVDDGGSGDDHALLDHGPGCEPGEEKNGVIFDIPPHEPGEHRRQNEKIE